MNHLSWSLKQIRMRIFESSLIVLAIGLGVGALCSVASLLFTFGYLSENELRGAQMITIVPAEQDRAGLWSLGSDASPVKLLGRVDAEPVVLTLDDIESLKTEVPAAKHAFTSRSMSLVLADAGPEPNVDYRTREGQERLSEWHRANSVYSYFTFWEAIEAEGMELESGSGFLQSDFDQGRPVAVIGQSLAKRLFGESDPVGQSIDFRLGRSPVSVTVVGVFRELGTEGPGGSVHSWVFSQPKSRLNDGLFLPYTALDTMYQTAQVTYSPATAIDRIMVVPSDDVDLGAALARIRSYVSSKYGLALSVTSPLENIQEIRETTRKLTIVIGAFGSVALVIAAVNALNLMIARVLRRTKSFGISAALGLSRRGIFAQFMTECFVLSILGALVGIGITAVFARIFSSYIRGEGIAVTVSLEVWMVGLGVAILSTLVFGLYPALQASRTDVVDALRTE